MDQLNQGIHRPGLRKFPPHVGHGSRAARQGPPLSGLLPLAVLLGGLCRSGAAQPEGSPRLFDSTWLEAGIHAGVPFGALHRSFGNAVGFRAGLATTYGDRLRGTGYLQYAPVDGDVPVHYLVAAAGLEALWTRQFSSTLLLSLHYARSRETHSPALQLDGGESEFGLDLRLGWSPELDWVVAPRLRSELGLAFTEPRTSVWLWTGVDFAWRLP